MQKLYRGHINRCEARNMTRAVIKMQSVYRGHVARGDAKDRCISILFIQCACRMYFARCELICLKSAVLIQCAWRSCVARQEFSSLRSATLIQCHWRSYLARCELNYLWGVRTSTRIQCCWRSYVARCRLRSLRSASLIQCCWRSFMARAELDYKKQLKREQSAVKIQYNWRKYIAKCIVMIQCCWRSYAARCILQDNLSAIIIQCCWRSKVARRELHENQSLYISSVMIQCCWRSHAARRERQEQICAVLIQCCWRSYIACCELHDHKSAIVIQCCWRIFVAKCDTEYLQSIVTLQCCWRSYVARCDLEYLMNVAIIQRCWRSYVARCDLEFLQSVSLIQRCWRCFSARQESKELKRVHYSICLQSWWRSLVARNDLRNRMSAAVIQRSWRSYVSRCELNDLRDLHASTFIQKVIRGFLVRWHVEFQHERATKIQTLWRCFTTQLNYQFDLVDVIVVQSIFRRRQALKVLKQKRESRDNLAAIVIQKNWRMHVNSMDFMETVASVVIVQSIVRQKAAYRILEVKTYERENAAATKIQTQWRMFSCSMKLLHDIADILIVQTYARRWIAMRFLLKVRLQRHNDSATQIERLVRGYLVRNRRRKHVSAVRIQAQLRRFIVENRYEDMCMKVIILQSVARQRSAHQLCGKIMHERDMKAAIMIQKEWRKYKCTLIYLHHLAGVIIVQNVLRRKFAIMFLRKKRLERDTAAATVIQKEWRKYNCTLKYLHHLAGVIIVQSVLRRKFAIMFLRKKRHERDTAAATVIQKEWRAFYCTMHFFHTVADVFVVQSVVRRWIAMRFLPKFRLQRHNECSTQIQRVMRGNIARIKLHKYYAARDVQTAWRAHVGRMRYLEMQKDVAAVKIQRVWRGFHCYMEFIFFIADILIVQRTMRAWLAIKHVRSLR